MTVSARFTAITVWILRAALLATSAWVLANGDWILGVTGLLMFATAVAPFALAKWTRWRVPGTLEVLVALPASAHLYGHTLGLYDLTGYDKALHFLVSLVPAFVIYVALIAWVERAGLQHRGGKDVGRGFIALATVALTVLVGVTWEVLEFATDAIFGLENQKDNFDTMVDLVLDASAGVLVAASGRWIRHAEGAVGETREAIEENVERAVDDGEAGA